MAPRSFRNALRDARDADQPAPEKPAPESDTTDDVAAVRTAMKGGQ